MSFMSEGGYGQAPQSQPPAGLPPTGQRTVVGSYVSPASSYTMTSSPKGGGSRGGRAGLILLIALVLALGGGAAYVYFMAPGLIDDVRALITGDDSRELTAEPGADWASASILAGAGTLAYDPSWTDVAELMGDDESLTELSEITGGSGALDGLWIIDGDLLGSGVMLMAFSAADVGAETDAELELHAFVEASTEEGQTLTTLSEEPVRTAHGLSGHVGEYRLTMDGQSMLVNVGVMVEGEQQVYLYTMGSEEFPGAITDLEAMMNSLTVG